MIRSTLPERSGLVTLGVSRLLDVCPEGDYARPTVSVVRDGKVTYRVYDVLRGFVDAAEAKAFADKHGIVDVQLVPER